MDPILAAITDALALLDDNDDIDQARDDGTLTDEADYLTAVYALRRLRDRTAGYGPYHDDQPRLHVADDDFAAVGHEQPADKRVAAIAINGTLMHLDAYRIVDPTDGDQSVAEGNDGLDVIHTAVGADGNWDTVVIDGAEHILIASVA